MNRTTLNSRTLLCLLSFTLVAPPVLVNLIPQAEARAGRGSSMGSRGGRTYSAPSYTRSSPSGAQPMQRSMTRPPAATPSSSPSAGATAGGGAAAASRPAQQAPASGGMGGSFTRGLIGGAIGAAGYNMLTGSKESNAQQTNQSDQSAQGQEQNGQQAPQKQGGGFMALLTRLVLIGLVIWLVMRFIRRRRAANNNTNNMSPNNRMNSSANPSMNTARQPVQQTNIQLQQDDYVAFQQRLIEVQDAWSKQDLGSLQKITTPEMLAYFNEQLTDLASRGLHNTVSNVQFLQGDLSEAWAEGNREYATVSMRYSLIDVTTDNTGNVVDGNPNQTENIAELWTFVRGTNNNWWLLSAIQQTN